jgi:hypothetical protein
MKTEPDPDMPSPEPGAQSQEPNTQAEFTEKTALAFFSRHLDELKWKYHRNEDRPSLFSGFNGTNAQWDFNLTARETSGGLFQLAVNSFIPNKALPPRRPAAMELLTRINFELALGCFEMNLADGEIRFRTSVAIPAPTLSALIPFSASDGEKVAQPDEVSSEGVVGVRCRIWSGIVEHLLRSNICIVDERYPQIMAVLYAGVTPEEALKPKEKKTGVPTEPRFEMN